jgi:hypothetical protein
VSVYGYYAFPKPSVQGFASAAHPADRNCRYLVQPPTVPSMARLRGYQRPPRGSKGRCRRACERTPLRGRRRCPAGGRHVFLSSLCVAVCLSRANSLHNYVFLLLLLHVEVEMERDVRCFSVKCLTLYCKQINVSLNGFVTSLHPVRLT